MHHHKQFVKSLYSARYSGWDDDKAWSFQDWKDDELIDDKTGTVIVCSQRGARPQQFIIGDDETELDLSLGSRSFLDRVNYQVWKRQGRFSTNVAEDDEKHSMIWGMFMCVTLEISSIHGEELLRQWAFHQKYKRSQQ